MRKRERENPCGVCGHYQKYEEGEVCGICGHRMAAVSDQSTAAYSVHSSAFPNSFTYQCLQDDKVLPFDDAIQFLGRLPLMAYLMKSKGWKLGQSYEWVKERRPSVELNQVVYQKLQEYEQNIYGSTENINAIATPCFSSSISPSFSFGFSKSNDRPTPLPAFSNATGTSIFSRPFDTPQEFTFGAAPTQKDDTSYNANTNITSAINDITMDVTYWSYQLEARFVTLSIDIPMAPLTKYSVSDFATCLMA
ncbi:hypothetical protein BUALT_Bualt03G0214500 [Buddleja alternifolia]|uniref:Protein-tyrosine-phosphatase IBR5 n=1 Tax=Buddleja alternifolia TaxID=168488 RepID=A0AAV6Y2X0_9LAMI|nr:hypothetical protein BUALT_Bualt03G0214500 [Buddleja alternifolia]